MAESRRARVAVSIASADVTNDISDDIKSFTYTDKAGNEADSLEIVLHDRDGKWIGPWYPETATKISAKIKVENGGAEGDAQTLDCGEFEIDSCGLSGPPDVFSIKAVSAPISSSVREEEKTRFWEGTTLRAVAGDIAGDGGLQLMYDAPDIQLDRVDQERRPDLGFLAGLCAEYGVSLKVTDGRLVLYEESAYERNAAADTFDKKETGGRLIRYSFSQDTGGTVSKSVAMYKDPKSGQMVRVDFEPPEPPATGQTEIVNARPGDLRGDNYRDCVDTASDDPGGTFDTGFKAFNETVDDFEDERADKTDGAMMQAMAAAREKNKHEWGCELKLVGNARMVGGATFELTGFGAYSGKYIVEEAAHVLGGGYTTTVKARKCLAGY